MHSPIFLIGTQRSGTTLLGKILSAHKDLYIHNEVPIPRVFKAGASREQIQAEIDNSVYNRHGKRIDDLLKAEGKSVWGLKDPQLTEHLPALRQFLPEARFIIIIRDPRAVVRSYIENAWGLGTNCYTGALRWNREVKEQLEFERELPGHVMKLRYEDLVLHPQESLERVCSFLGLPFDESMLDYSNKKSFVSNNRQSVNTFRALDPAIVTKWKNELSEHEVKVINTVCKDLMEVLDYKEEIGETAIPGWMKLWYLLHQKVLGEIQIQYRWRFGGHVRAVKSYMAKKSLIKH